MVTRKPIAARVAETTRAGGSPNMDTEGRDIDFIIPGPWPTARPRSRLISPEACTARITATCRVLRGRPARLKSMVLAPATDPAWARR